MKMELNINTLLEYRDKKWQKQVKEIKIISIHKNLHSAVIYVKWKSNKYSLNLFKIDYIKKIFKETNK